MIVVCKVSVLEVIMKPGVVVYKDGLEGVIVSRDDINHLVSRILVESDYACRWYWIYEWSEKSA